MDAHTRHVRSLLSIKLPPDFDAHTYKCMHGLLRLSDAEISSHFATTKKPYVVCPRYIETSYDTMRWHLRFRMSDVCDWSSVFRTLMERRAPITIDEFTSFLDSFDAGLYERYHGTTTFSADWIVAFLEAGRHNTCVWSSHCVNQNCKVIHPCSDHRAQVDVVVINITLKTLSYLDAIIEHAVALAKRVFVLAPAFMRNALSELDGQLNIRLIVKNDSRPSLPDDVDDQQSVILVDASFPPQQLARVRHMDLQSIPHLFYCDYYTKKGYTVDRRFAYMRKGCDREALLTRNVGLEIVAKDEPIYLMYSCIQLHSIARTLTLEDIGSDYVDSLVLSPLAPPPDKTRPTIALLLHVGSPRVFDLMRPQLLKVQRCKQSVDVYVNVSINVGNVSDMVERVRSFFDGIDNVVGLTIISNENRGFDIGGCLHLLEYIKETSERGGPHYRYYVVCHTKNDDVWRDMLLSSVLDDLDRNLSRMDQSSVIGIMGAKQRLYVSAFESNCINQPHLHALTQTFNVRRTNVYEPDRWTFYFVGGTIFLCRAQVLERFLRANIGQLIAGLNTCDSFDWNWYLLPYVHPDLAHIPRTPAAALEHYTNHGKKEGRSPNLFHAILKTDRKSNLFRDGMIEHAYERLFGILAKEHELLVIGI